MTSYADLLKIIKREPANQQLIDSLRRRVRSICTELHNDLDGVNLTDDMTDQLGSLLEAKFGESDLEVTVRAGSPPVFEVTDLGHSVLGNYSEDAYNLRVVSSQEGFVLVYLAKVPRGGNTRE